MRIAALILMTAVCALGETNPLTQAVTSRYNSVKQYLIASAELVPDDSYEFHPSPGQRPFREWLEHTATSSYGFCASIRGVTAPDTSRVHGLAKKADVQKALAESFAYCDESLKQATDAKALEPVNGKYPVAAMVGLVSVLNEHYGNLVGYLRALHITPPSSEKHSHP